MIKWLAIAAVAALAASTAGAAQLDRGLVAPQAARVATTRALDFRLSQELGAQRQAPLIRGMLVHHALAPNAIVGVGLANIYAKSKASSQWSVGDPAPRSRKPAVTFVFKF
jgi:hypothetical protein